MKTSKEKSQINTATPRKPLTWKDVRLVPITSKDYANGYVLGRPMGNYPEYVEHSLRLLTLYRNDDRKLLVDMNCRTFGDNRKFLTKMLGKRQFVYQGEFFYSGWHLDLNGTRVIVVASKRGTCYEAVTEDHLLHLSPDISKIIEFMGLVGAATECRS